MRFIMLAAALLLLGLIVPASDGADAASTDLFNFETGDLASWSPVKLADAKEDAPTPRFELSSDGATSGKQALKITFAGGNWPVISTSAIAVKGTWKEYQTLLADLTVDRDFIAYIGIGQGLQDHHALKPQWQKTLMLHPGRNEVALTIRHGLGRTVIDPKAGEITSFIIGAFRPHEGDVLRVDHIRLTGDWPPPQVTGWYSPYNHDGYSAWAAADYQRTGAIPSFAVLGTDLHVKSYEELSKSLKDSWKPTPTTTVEQSLSLFKEKFEQLKKAHPAAIMAILRDSDTHSWQFAYLNCHGPDGPNAGRESAGSQGETVEAFMRHRGVLLQPDLSSIPHGSTILAAQLLATRVIAKDSKPISKANLYVAEPCNRAWDPQFANCYFYAKDKHWKAVSGIYYGQDPDFFPVLLFRGPGSSPVNVWDFTAGLKFWIEQDHDNHGFFLYGDSGDYMRIYTPRAKDPQQRPAIFVVYLPPGAK